MSNPQKLRPDARAGRTAETAEHAKSLEWSQTDFAIAALLTVFAFLSRGYGLGDAALIDDEYYTVWHADERYLRLTNPAYYLLVHLSRQVFGVTEWASRLPAMILGAISIPLFFATWRQIIGRNAATIGAILILFSSWHLWFSQFSRFYSGVFLFGLLSFYFYYRAMILNDLRRLAYAIACNILAMLFHATAVIVPIACGFFSVAVLLSGSHATDFSKRIARIQLAIYGAIGLATTGVFLGIAGEWMAKGASKGPGPVELLLQCARDVELPVGLAAIFGVVWLLQRDTWKGIFFALGMGIPTLLMIAASPFMEIKPHYMFYSFSLMIAAAAVLCEAMRAYFSRDARIVGYVGVVLIVVGVLPRFASHYTDRFRPDVRDAIRFVAERYQPGDRILTVDKGFFHYAPTSLSTPMYMDWPYVESFNWERTLSAYLSEPGRIWIVLPMSRRPFALRVEQWLLTHGRLMQREYGKRLDYTMNGYQIFLITPGDRTPANPPP